MKLNLGCGPTRKCGYTGVDYRRIRKVDCVDIVCDLNITPWPWADNSIEAIYTAHCLEHLENPITAFREMHRVLKVGGEITIVVPHSQSVLAYSRTHLTRFSTIWFYSWIQSWRGCQGDFEDDPQLFSGRISWRFFSPTVYFREPYPFWFKVFFHAIRIFSLPLEKLLNLHPVMLFAWEKLSIFGPDELVFEARKI